MRKLTTTLALGLVLGFGLMAAPSLYAQDDQAQPAEKSDQGTMRGGMMGQGTMGGMGGMMTMMRQMSEMMNHCNRMMSEHHMRGNERKRTPRPEKEG